ncbi:hypothetical protein CAPTEDRAFT_220050 [Capitella teleta]|uniref:Alpha-1,3-mannosyl-glycoprotein 2-beta-N-acetylglucosaminyltransferase n=1 Tax=Capitella teleta TaxID=283909 RepID=R7V7X2_CAPTE|nr:hypothetical protein CAPTEDRAFT_220050 [Capitella teleta]|eukprot:ELU14958.1 hypothetical protein CAPTEDRAFT_220050 [Capitella teleta]
MEGSSPFEQCAVCCRLFRFSDHAKQLFDKLGSGLVQNLKFRDVWAFAGQSGIVGYSDIEEIEFVPPTLDWPRSIDKKVCVPTKIVGSKIKPDPLANKNEKRRNFCAKFDGYGDFCETDHVDEALSPAPLTDKALERHKIFQVPIVVIPGLNHNAVRMQLETLLLNPGIQPDMVIVMYDEKFSEPASLAELFGFKAAALASSTKYIFQMEKALEKVWEVYPKAEHVVVLEEEVIPSQDLLSFLAQCLSTVEADPSLAGISAWNENGYQGVSWSPSLVYRVASTLPGLGFLLKRSFYEAAMKGKMDACCHLRSWDGWSFSSPTSDLQAAPEMVVPDVSRVYRRPYEGLSEQADFLKQLFNRPRVTNMDVDAKLSNVASLSKAAYELEMEQMLQTASFLDTANVGECLSGKGMGFTLPPSAGSGKRQTSVVYFEQSAEADMSILKKLAHCFSLFAAPGHDPRGLHRASLRFTVAKGDHTVLLVGSKSPYIKFMPQDYKIIKLTQLS